MQFSGFLSGVNCISSRTVSTERTYQQPQCGSGARLLRGKDRGACREQGPLWVSIVWELQKSQRWMTMRKILVTFPSELQKWIKRIIGWSISRRVNICLFSRKWNHNKNSTIFLMGQHPGLSTRSWSTTGWILQCLWQTKRGPALKNRLDGDAEMCKGLLNRESLRATDGVKYFRRYVETPLHQRELRVCSSGDSYQFQSSKKSEVIEMVKGIGRVLIALWNA